jgi:hypothetical protein
VDPDVAETGQPYAYTGDDPVNGTDPLGLCIFGGSWCNGIQNSIASNFDSFRHTGAWLADRPGVAAQQAVTSIYNAYDGIYQDGANGCSFFSLATQENVAGALLADEGAGLMLSGEGEIADGVEAIDTPYGLAHQEFSSEAQQLRDSVANGQTVYRQGQFGDQEAAEGQFWAPNNPLTTQNYSEGYGTSFNGEPDWVIGGEVGSGESFVTRSAPSFGSNTGGNLEVVTNPGAIGNLWFHMP